MKKILLMGPPGSGKGTQASALTEKFGWPVVPAGDLLRAEIKNKTPLGQEIAALINKGHLVPDQTIIQMIEKKLVELTDAPVVLIDGFPRTVGQAKALEDSGLGVQAVINLNIDTELLVERLSGRRIATSSGQTYHILHNPPLKEGVDDLTGEELVQREDDKPESIRTRMATYHTSTAPVLDFYEKKVKCSQLPFIMIDASLPISEVFDKICAFIAPLVNEKN